MAKPPFACLFVPIIYQGALRHNKKQTGTTGRLCGRGSVRQQKKKRSVWIACDCRKMHLRYENKAPPCRCSPISNLHEWAGGFSVWYVCASNIRVYPGGLRLDTKTFRNPVLKMWVKKRLLSYRAGILPCLCRAPAGEITPLLLPRHAPLRWRKPHRRSHRLQPLPAFLRRLP